MADTNGDRAQKVARAYELATVHRWSQRQIAAELGVSQPTVSAWIAEGRVAEGHIHLVDRAEQRVYSAHRLDFWNAELVTTYRRGGISLKDAVPLAVALEKRRADLLGLDAPTRVQVDQPVPEPDPEVMAAVREAQRVAHAEQAAIEARERAADGTTDER